MSSRLTDDDICLSRIDSLAKKKKKKKAEQRSARR